MSNTSPKTFGTQKLPRFGNALYALAGAGVLVLNKIRHEWQGYKTPRPFSSENAENIRKAVAYDLSVTENWENILKKYTESNHPFEGRTVLELGPGPDLGVGSFLLAKGADEYTAFDVQNLLPLTPDAFYDELDVTLKKFTDEKQLREIQAERKKGVRGERARLTHVHDAHFDLEKLGEKKYSLIASQAAFEHFLDIEKTISQISAQAKPKAIFMAEIGLQTHTRVLMYRDPLNIYRYSDGFYNLFRFQESPNRMRPQEYIDALRKNGWTDIQMTAKEKVADEYFRATFPHLNKRFQNPESQMEIITFVLCARKK